MHKSGLSIAVDIDGVLTNETEGHDYENRTPNELNIRWVRFLVKLGCKITLFSSRYPEDMDVTKRWMERYNVPYHDIILGKPQYDVFIDDKALSNFPSGEPNAHFILS